MTKRVQIFQRARAVRSVLLSIFVLLTLSAVPFSRAGDESPPSESEAKANTLVGVWKLTLAAPGGVKHPKLTIRRRGDQLKGSLKGQQGSSTLRDLKFDGSRFSFHQTLNTPKGSIQMKFTGTVQGDQMQGVAKLPMGTLPFKGKRRSS